MPELFATKGEIVTCVNDHPICEVAHDIFAGDMPKKDSSEFTNWQQPIPEIGTPSSQIHCTLCGSPWFNGGTRQLLLELENDAGDMVLMGPNGLHIRGRGWTR